MLLNQKFNLTVELMQEYVRQYWGNNTPLWCADGAGEESPVIEIARFQRFSDQVYKSFVLDSQL